MGLRFLFARFLELKLVTESKLEYRMVTVTLLEYLCATDVVASVQADIHILVRDTYWDREVESLDYVRVSVVLSYHKARLNTSFQCQSFCHIEVRKNRNVQVAWTPSSANVILRNLEALERVEQTTAQANQWRNVLFQFCSTYETCFVVSTVCCYRCAVQTDLRLDSEITC